MAIQVAPLPLPASADPSKFKDFGREVKGVDVGNLSPEQFKEVEQLLYKVGGLPLRDEGGLTKNPPVAQRPPVSQHHLIARTAVRIDQGACLDSCFARIKDYCNSWCVGV